MMNHLALLSLCLFKGLYTFADIQLYTNNFSKENLLGEGSIGHVYKVCCPKGQDFVVKNINMVELSVPEEGQFQYVAFTMLGLRHPNIVSLIDYCKEHGQCLLFYEYVWQHTLKDYLHYPEDPAPEHGKRGIDKTKSDVYEFGVLLLELLTGKLPFDRIDFVFT